jgi:ketol-acid reductoisomerase
VTARILFDRDLDFSILEGLRIAIIGYGSQGRAHALNLRDSGFPPAIGLRPGPSFDRAGRDGFVPVSPHEAVSGAGFVMILTPDESHAEVCRDDVFPVAADGTYIGFAAAFTVHFGVVRMREGLRPVLVAPKGPGSVLRRTFEEGRGIPAMVAAAGDETRGLELAGAYARALGCGRAGVLRTTFREEAVADLFGEQCVLCGGLVELMKESFGVLVDRGYTPEAAYIECVAEVEYIASLVSRVGLAGLYDNISTTAAYGGLSRGPRVLGPDVRTRLERILDEIEDGRFYEEFRRLAGRLGDEQGVRKALERMERARAGFKTEDGDERES